MIVYTGRALSADDEHRLRRYSSSIIVKGARSPERLLDEVTLFLHRVESELPAEQQRLLNEARNRESNLEGRRILVVEDDVLMDVMMPEMDGPKATREIRRRPALAKLPIIVAKAMRDDQERCLAAGANDYLAKPLDAEMLLSLLRVWMPRQRAALTTRSN